MTIDKIAEAFLTWRLPPSVCCDPCATQMGKPDRIGTNLLTLTEAKDMVTYLFGVLFNETRQLENEIKTLRASNEHLLNQANIVRSHAMRYQLRAQELEPLVAKVADLEAEIAMWKERNSGLEAEVSKHVDVSLSQFTKDDPQCDGTDAAHPAWWRGNDAGVKSTALIVLSLLDGQEPKGGTFALPELNTIRDRIWSLASQLRGSQAYSELVEGDKWKFFNLVQRVKEVLREADAIVLPKKES